MVDFIKIFSGQDYNEEITSTSLIINFIEDELKSIDDNLLNNDLKDKKKHLILICKEAKPFKVPDAHNLKQIFDLFRNPKIKFDEL